MVQKPGCAPPLPLTSFAAMGGDEDEDVGGAVRVLRRHWKFSRNEIRRSLIALWRTSRHDPSVVHDLVGDLYSLFVQERADGALQLLVVHIIVSVGQQLPLQFQHNFSGLFASYRRTSYWHALYLLFSLGAPGHLRDNIPVLVDSLRRTLTDEAVDRSDMLSVPALAACIDVAPTAILAPAIERHILSSGRSPDRQRIADIDSAFGAPKTFRSGKPLYCHQMSGAALDALTRLPGSAMPATVTDCIIARGASVLEALLRCNGAGDPMSDQSVQMMNHAAALIQILRLAPEFANDVLNATRADAVPGHVFVYAVERALDVPGCNDALEQERLVQVATTTYTDPLVAFRLIRLVDRHGARMRTWLSTWYRAVLKIGACFPGLYTRELSRMVVRLAPTTPGLLAGILSLPLLTSTIEFTQAMEADLDLRTAFKSAIQDDVDVVRVYTHLLLNRSDGNDEPPPSPTTIADRSRLWRRSTPRVQRCCAHMKVLVGTFLDAVLGSVDHQRYQEVAETIMELFLSWNVGDEVRVELCNALLGLFARAPALIVTMRPLIERVVSEHRDARLRPLVKHVVYAIGEHCLRLPDNVDTIASYIDCVEQLVLDQVEVARQANRDHMQECGILPPWSSTGSQAPAIPSDEDRHQIIHVGIVALTKLAVAFPKRVVAPAFQCVLDSASILPESVVDRTSQALTLLGHRALTFNALSWRMTPAADSETIDDPESVFTTSSVYRCRPIQGDHV